MNLKPTTRTYNNSSNKALCWNCSGNLLTTPHVYINNVLSTVDAMRTQNITHIVIIIIIELLLLLLLWNYYYYYYGITIIIIIIMELLLLLLLLLLLSNFSLLSLS
jgi:hypothetical protein